MGEISELMQEGILCVQCGAFVGEGRIVGNGGTIEGSNITKHPGFPLKCTHCKPVRKKKKPAKDERILGGVE